MEDSLISEKSYGDIMEDYFGVLLNTTIEVLEDIDDDVLKLSVRNWTLSL